MLQTAITGQIPPRGWHTSPLYQEFHYPQGQVTADPPGIKTQEGGTTLPHADRDNKVCSAPQEWCQWQHCPQLSSKRDSTYLRCRCSAHRSPLPADPVCADPVPAPCQQLHLSPAPALQNTGKGALSTLLLILLQLQALCSLTLPERNQVSPATSHQSKRTEGSAHVAVTFQTARAAQMSSGRWCSACSGW